MSSNKEKQTHSKPVTSRYPKKKTEHPEFRKGKSEYLICPICNSVYYEKAWHHNLSEDRHLREDKNVKFQMCPADKMIKAKEFEGQLILENVPEIIKSDLLNLIRNMGKTAFEKDPLHRVISIKENKNQIEILTTENQLSVRIAKKIAESFKNKMKGVWEIKYSHQEDPSRVVWKKILL